MCREAAKPGCARRTGLVLATFFLLGAIDNCAGLADGPSKVALRVHITDFLRRTDNLPTNEKKRQLGHACKAMEYGFEDVFIRCVVFVSALYT